MMHPSAPVSLMGLFVVIPVVVAILVYAGVMRACPASASTSRWRVRTLAALIALFAVPAALAASGMLLRFDSLPPPFVLMMAVLIGSATWAAFSRAGTAVLEHHGYAALIGLQAFRFPLELAMHHAADLGVMPSIMSYSGRNFDVFTGISALALWPWLLKRRLPRSLIWIWNVLGLGLLLNVMVVAIRATPVFGHFGETQLNTWVAYVPFVWLPSVLVTVAWAGHLLVFRKLLRLESD